VVFDALEAAEHVHPELGGDHEAAAGVFDVEVDLVGVA
jgi:hypothetical protein